MSEPQDNPNRLGGLKEYTENLKLITGYMRILNSNYNKKKDETIRVLKKAGYTIEVQEVPSTSKHEYDSLRNKVSFE